MRNLLKKVSVFVLTMVMAISAVININCVKATETLTSSDISVVGYQIKTNVTSRQGISFRTVCKAPDKGSIIVVNDKNYTVTNVGTIYAKDINTTGNNASNVLDKSYTELNPIAYSEEYTKGYGFKYVGIKEYDNKIVTFGYIATKAGISKSEEGVTTYVRTMTNMEPYVTNTLFIRAFVEAVDEQGNPVIIYGQYASLVSVAEVAYAVYMEGKAPDLEGHNYIYNFILNSLNETSPYYKDTTEEYGWGEAVQP